VSSSIHIILRCNAPPGDGPRCAAYLIGSAGEDIEQVRERAKAKAWTFSPGRPYRHVGAADYCPDHPRETR
jgi:hypothetical protein